jgi:hypothetical protein
MRAVHEGGFGPAAAFGLACSLQFEEPVVVAIVWFAEVLWRGLLGWQPLPVAGAPFEPESPVMAQVVVMATLCRLPDYADFGATLRHWCRWRR